MERQTEQRAQKLAFDRDANEQIPLEIVAYQKRHVLVLLSILCFAVPAFLFLILGFVLIEQARYTGKVGYDDIFSFVIAIGSTGLVFGSLGLWLITLLGKMVAILTIHPQGITIGKRNSRFSLSLSWSEIASIYATVQTTHNQSQKFLCIRPKNLEQYLARCSRVKRLISRINIATLGVPLGVAQDALTIPIEEILQQISSAYADELDRYEIQLRLECVCFWK